MAPKQDGLASTGTTAPAWPSPGGRWRGAEGNAPRQDGPPRCCNALPRIRRRDRMPSRHQESPPCPPTAARPLSINRTFRSQPCTSHKITSLISKKHIKAHTHTPLLGGFSKSRPLQSVGGPLLKGAPRLLAGPLTTEMVSESAQRPLLCGEAIFSGYVLTVIAHFPGAEKGCR